MSVRIRVRQDVTIDHLSHDGDRLQVHVSTRSGRRHWIRFSFDDLGSLSAHLTTLRRWMHLGTPLTYVSSGAEGTLIDDRAWFAAAFDGTTF
jgi:hypothetical protein